MLENHSTQKSVTHKDPTDDGMRARAHGKRRDLCPYPLGSEERHEWLEGYDGVNAENAPLVPDTKL